MTDMPPPQGRAGRSTNTRALRRSGTWAARRRMLGWWSGTILLAIVCLLQIGTLWARGAALDVILTPAMLLVGFVLVRVSAFFDFQRGWRQGFESAQRMALQDRLGLMPDVVARAAFHRSGDPTPTPWDPHTPLILRRAHEGDSAS